MPTALTSPKRTGQFTVGIPKIDIFVFGAEGAAAYKTGPVCSMPASCAGAIFNSGRSFR